MCADPPSGMPNDGTELNQAFEAPRGGVGRAFDHATILGLSQSLAARFQPARPLPSLFVAQHHTHHAHHLHFLGRRFSKCDKLFRHHTGDTGANTERGVLPHHPLSLSLCVSLPRLSLVRTLGHLSATSLFLEQSSLQHDGPLGGCRENTIKNDAASHSMTRRRRNASMILYGVPDNANKWLTSAAGSNSNN